VTPLDALHPLVVLTFPAAITVGEFSVRLETLVTAVSVFAALVLARLIARRTAIDTSRPPGAPSADPDDPAWNFLRPSDLLFIAMAALPGAVIGGRAGYGLLHLDFLVVNPDVLWQISWGGMQLSLAVVGGTFTAVVVMLLLGAPVRRWLHALALPLLLVLAGGKFAMFLGGAGQGLAWDGTWATAYQGVGPWGSLGPDVPSYPSAAIEALATLVLFFVVGWLMLSGLFRSKSGAAFFLALGLWAAIRVVVATTWRDPYVAGPLRMDQLISMWIALVCLGGLAMVFLYQFTNRERAAPRLDADLR
jgi:prolipoprotein diacylglyceryltransferase